MATVSSTFTNRFFSIRCDYESKIVLAILDLKEGVTVEISTTEEVIDTVSFLVYIS